MREQFLNINLWQPISLREFLRIRGIRLRNVTIPGENRISRKFLPDTLRIRYVMAAGIPMGLNGPMKRQKIR